MGEGVGLGVGLGEGVGEGVGDGLGVGVGASVGEGVGDGDGDAAGAVAGAAVVAVPPVVTAGFSAGVSHPPTASAASTMATASTQWTVFLIRMYICFAACARKKHPPLFSIRIPMYANYYTSKKCK